MKKVLFIILLFTIFCQQWPVAAQKSKNEPQTIYTVNGDVYHSRVYRITPEVVRFDPFYNNYATINYFSRSYVDSIVFNDGAVLRFDKDGVLSRNNLLSIPNMKVKTDGIYAEGLIKLTKEETMDLLGKEKYLLYYKPSNSNLTLSYIQLFSGGASLLSFLIFDKKMISFSYGDRTGIAFQRMGFHSTAQLLNSEYLYKGDFDPFLVSMEFLGSTTFISGLCNLITARSKLLSALNSETPYFNLSSTKVKYWTGIGCMLAGTGCLIGGTLDMASKKHWDWQFYSEGSRYNRQIGQWPVAGPILALAGSILINVGLTQFTVSSTRLKGYSQLNNSSKPLTLNTSITPYGYGITMNF